MQRSLIAQPLIDLLNKVDPPARIMFHCAPLRIIRVITTDDSFKTFRVEQLVITNRDAQNPRGSWHTLSTHGSEVVGQSYGVAAEAAVKAQGDLRRKLQQRVDKQRIMRP